MNAKLCCRALGIGLLVLLFTGCGNYTITFQPGDVINAPGADLSREMLDIDVVLLTKKDAKKHPQILEGTMRSDEWFKARDEDADEIATIPAGQILALRSGSSSEKRDSLKGGPLLSACDVQGRSPNVTFEFEHPDAGAGEAAIVIYGRFVGESRAGVDAAADHSAAGA